MSGIPPIPGRVALVTAASAGLGYACARALAEQGAEIAIASRDRARIDDAAARLAHETGARPLALVGDLAEPGTPKRLVAEVAEHLGDVEILVANVGGPTPGGLGTLDESAWAAGVGGVLVPAIELMRAVLPKMRRARFGRVVHVLSVTARVPVDGLAISNALRPAVAGLIADAARDNAVHGITINGVCPGYTRTRRLEELGAASPDALRALEERIPAQRLAAPEEIAAPVAFLASDRASYVNGAILPVDGALSARPS